MITKVDMCPYCQVNSGGEHESACPMKEGIELANMGIGEYREWLDREDDN